MEDNKDKVLIPEVVTDEEYSSRFYGWNGGIRIVKISPAKLFILGIFILSAAIAIAFFLAVSFVILLPVVLLSFILIKIFAKFFFPHHKR